MKVWLKNALNENSSKTVMLELPATEHTLAECMQALNLPIISIEDNCTVVKTEDFDVPITDKKINIDELQFLSRKLAAFDELETFYAAAKYNYYTYLQELINLAYSVENNDYYLISNFDEITDNEVDELLREEPVDVSKYGVLYQLNYEPKWVYKGLGFPECIHRPCVLENVLTGQLANGMIAKEYLYMPCEDICIDKAINRILLKGAAHVDISIFKDRLNSVEDNIVKMVGNELNKEKLYILNSISQKIYDADIEDLSDSRFRSVLEYCHPQDINELETVLQNYNDFYFIIGIDDSKGYGEYLLYESGKYEVPIELEDYIDSSAFGDDALEGMLYKFTDEGFVRYDGDCDDIFEMIKRTQEETQDISKLCDENSIEMR